VQNSAKVRGNIASRTSPEQPRSCPRMPDSSARGATGLKYWLGRYDAALLYGSCIITICNFCAIDFDALISNSTLHGDRL
jgi:hypothetical protein